MAFVTLVTSVTQWEVNDFMKIEMRAIDWSNEKGYVQFVLSGKKGWKGTASAMIQSGVASVLFPNQYPIGHTCPSMYAVLGKRLKEIARKYPRRVFSFRRPGTGQRVWVLLATPLSADEMITLRSCSSAFVAN